MKLRFATDFALPAEAVTQTFAILAKRGAGHQQADATRIGEAIPGRAGSQG